MLWNTKLPVPKKKKKLLLSWITDVCLFSQFLAFPTFLKFFMGNGDVKEVVGFDLRVKSIFITFLSYHSNDIIS